jgi:hypothetical protein
VSGATISAVAFCPHPPLLLPRIAVGAPIETESLRSASANAIETLIDADQLVVLGAAGRAVRMSDFAPGVGPATAAEDEIPVPLAHLVAKSLTRDAGTPPSVFVAVSADGRPAQPWPPMSGRTALLVMGDASARRSLKGPGYLDPRAKPFDDAVVAALAAGSPRDLASLDRDLAADLLVAGAGPWVAAAQLLGLDTRWRAEVLYADAPFGVMYVVATWLPA